MPGAGPDAAVGALIAEEPPPLSISSAGSGFMLLSNVSTGMAAGGGAGVFSAVLASGVFMGMPLLGGKNLPGNFN